VAAFIARFRDERPWYFSIQAKVKNADDEWQTFIKTLGISDKAGMASSWFSFYMSGKREISVEN
jgi:hypothetical protein